LLSAWQAAPSLSQQLNAAYVNFHGEGTALTIVRLKQPRANMRKYLFNLAGNITLVERPNLDEVRGRRGVDPASAAAAAAQPLLDRSTVPLETDVESLAHTDAPSFSQLVAKWPLRDVKVSTFWDSSATFSTAVSRQTTLEFVELLLPGIRTEGKPNYHMMAIVCSRLLQCMPSGTLSNYDSLADEWDRRYSGVGNSERPSWAACQMVLMPYDGEASVDHADMAEFVVKVPTQEQFEEWTVVEKLDLLARMLGLPAFYINLVRSNATTPPLRDYHAIIEHIAPKLGFSRATLFPGVEDVRTRSKQTKSTKSFTELTLRAPALFERLVSAFLGRHDYIDLVLAQSFSIQDLSPPLSAAAKALSGSILEIVSSLSMAYPQHSLVPLKALERDLERCATRLDMIGHPVTVSGPTTSGKSTMLSSLATMLAPYNHTLALLPSDETESFLILFNSMAPKAKQLSKEDLHALLRTFGSNLEQCIDHPKNVEILFEKPFAQPSTESLVSIIRFLMSCGVSKMTSVASAGCGRTSSSRASRRWPCESSCCRRRGGKARTSPSPSLAHSQTLTAC
jgi:hypothetical protein